MAAIAQLVRHVEHHTRMYNHTIDLVHNAVRVGVHMTNSKLKRIVKKLRHIRVLLTKAATAYKQAKILHRRVQSRHEYVLIRGMRSENHPVTITQLNDMEVHKGVLHMYIAYVLKQTTDAGTLIDKVLRKVRQALQ